ncbi:MAG: histidine kinase, partial [Bacteroidota bacterium]
LTSLNPTEFLLAKNNEEVLKISYNDGKFSTLEHIEFKHDLFSATELESPDTLFLGTGAGLFHVKEKEVLPTVLSNYPLSVYAIAKSDEALWLGTNNGLYRYTYQRDEFTYYSTDDGLTSNVFLQQPPIYLPDGRISMSTVEGMISFDPTSFTDKNYLNQATVLNKPESRPIWYDLKINNSPILDPLQAENLVKLKLSHTDNTLSFRLASPGIFSRGKAKLTFQLVGIDSQPIDAGIGNFIRYPNLPAGDFQLILKSYDGNNQQRGKRVIPITITPPFYRQPWFLPIVVLTLLVLIVAIYLLLLNRAIRKQTRLRENQARITAERDRIAAELHDDLGGDLASMAFILDGHKSLRQMGVETELDVNRLEQLATGAIKNMREMIWVLDDEQATLPTLAEQLLNGAREMASAADLSLQVDIPDDLPELPLSSIQKKSILLIAKESMQNIRKHAQASAFTLRLTVEKDYTLLLSISDNGRGLKAVETASTNRPLNHGHGLKNLRKRAQEINADLSLAAALPRGTKMTLRVPLTQ